MALSARTRIQDVAAAAGVSIKTVSRIMNDEPGVRAETGVRVRTAMSGLDYQPSLHARRAAHELGLDVSGELAVAGFDDTQLSGIVWPMLTTIHQPRRDMSYAATACRSTPSPAAARRPRPGSTTE